MVTPGNKGLTLAMGLLLMALVEAAAAGPFEEGFDAFTRGDYPEAIRLYREAAEQGIVEAQFNLGLMLSRGQGVAPNYAEAALRFRQAAEQGYAAAQFMLGLLYNTGQGVSHDDTEAVRWFRQAAEQGYAAAQLMLGAMYKEGKGVQPDYVQAHIWFNLGAARFPTSEAEVHALVSQARAYLATKMSPSQVATAQKLAREWRPK